MKNGVERALPHLVELEVVLLLRIGVLGKAVDLGQRRTDDVVDDATELSELVDVVQRADLHHVPAVLEPS